ncbi:MAG: penicillin-binding protein [Oscillospiraceae bacterium]|nr:penicillin-binding protein [Oscillospiraceae bacterium]
MASSQKYIRIPDHDKVTEKSDKPKTKKKKGLTPWQIIKHVMSVIGTTFLTLFLIIVITCCIVAVALSVYITQFADSMYDVDLKDVELSYSSFVYAMDKELGEFVPIHQISADENRIWVDLEEIPQHTLDALVATEDKRYYEHGGVDWSRTVGATIETFFNDKMQGGSTISQQLIRDITKDDDVNIGRKLREIFRAISLEQKYSKHDILESYLNRIAFGNTTYGIGSAARHYFDKEVSELTVAESCILIGLIRSPVSWNPYTNPYEARKWQVNAIWNMYDQGYITHSQYEAARNEKIQFRLPISPQCRCPENQPRCAGDYFGYIDERYNEYYGIQDVEDEEEDLYFENVSWADMIADPYRWTGYEVTVNWYTDAALKDVVNDLADMRGITREAATALLKRGGYSIYLNVDVELQDKLEAVWKNQYIIRNPDFPYPPGTPAEDTLQGAFVIIDYYGSVVALVGGAGDKPGNDCFNRATMANRNVGSTIKPFAIYAPAIDANRITYSTMLLDRAGEIDDFELGDRRCVVCTGHSIDHRRCWPQNFELDYGTGTYMTAVDALIHSKNTISARTLYLNGIQNAFNFMQDKLGITTLLRSHHLTYSSISTGAVEIKLHELAASYQIFGNGGVYYKPSLYSKVVDNLGKTVLEQSTVGIQAIEKDSAWIMNRMMLRVVEYTGGTANYSKIPGIEVIGKTGTANDMANLLYCGLTPDYVAVVRIGFDDDRAIKGISVDRWRSLARIWHDTMIQVIPLDEPRTFTPEPSVIVQNYCTYTGLIAIPGSCPSSSVGYYRKSNIPALCNASSHDSSYWATYGQETRPYYKNP